MSVQDTDTQTVPTAGSPNVPRSASYMGCRHCEEGNLVYDYEAEASRCSSCGELD